MLRPGGTQQWFTRRIPQMTFDSDMTDTADGGGEEKKGSSVPYRRSTISPARVFEN